MLEKCRKHPVSKYENTKAVRRFEKNNYRGNDLHAKRNKIERLKSPLRINSQIFASYPISMFSILGLKLKLKSKV